MISRRSLLSSGVGLTLAGPALSRTRGTQAGPCLVLVILRGGLDGLAAVPAPGDPHYDRARAAPAGPAAGNVDALLDLDGFFALHGRLAGLKGLYDAGELAVLHATAPPYRDRSHFRAQDVLDQQDAHHPAADVEEVAGVVGGAQAGQGHGVQPPEGRGQLLVGRLEAVPEGVPLRPQAIDGALHRRQGLQQQRQLPQQLPQGLQSGIAAQLGAQHQGLEPPL